jgi:hypothetical protein
VKHPRTQPTLLATAPTPARPRRAPGLQSLDEAKLARVMGGASAWVDGGITAMDDWEAPVV